MRKVLMSLWTGATIAGFVVSGLYQWRGPEAYVAGMAMCLIGVVISLWPVFVERAAAIRKGAA